MKKISILFLMLITITMLTGCINEESPIELECELGYTLIGDNCIEGGVDYSNESPYDKRVRISFFRDNIFLCKIIEISEPIQYKLEDANPLYKDIPFTYLKVEIIINYKGSFEVEVIDLTIMGGINELDEFVTSKGIIKTPEIGDYYVIYSSVFTEAANMHDSRYKEDYHIVFGSNSELIFLPMYVESTDFSELDDNLKTILIEIEDAVDEAVTKTDSDYVIH